MRGRKKNFGEANVNRGNFLILVKLISNFDFPFAADQARDDLLAKIREARFYDLHLNPTLDLTHKEQPPQIVRYVDIDQEQETGGIRVSSGDRSEA